MSFKLNHSPVHALCFIAHARLPEIFPALTFVLTILAFNEQRFLAIVKVKATHFLFLQHWFAHCCQELAAGFAIFDPGYILFVSGHCSVLMKFDEEIEDMVLLEWVLKL